MFTQCVGYGDYTERPRDFIVPVFWKSKTNETEGKRQQAFFHV